MGGSGTCLCLQTFCKRSYLGTDFWGLHCLPTLSLLRPHFLISEASKHTFLIICSASWFSASPHLQRTIYWPPSYPVTPVYDTSYSSLLKHEIHMIFNFSTVNSHIFNIHSPGAWGEKYVAFVVVRKVGGSEGTWEAEVPMVKWLRTWDSYSIVELNNETFHSLKNKTQK